jgi:hypothetical protein
MVMSFFILFKTYLSILRMKTQSFWILDTILNFMRRIGNHHVPIIFDTGASLAIMPDADDFIAPPTLLGTPMKLGGMVNNLEIRGVGTVCWTFEAADGSDIQIWTHSYWVTKSRCRTVEPSKALQ